MSVGMFLCSITGNTHETGPVVVAVMEGATPVRVMEMTAVENSSVLTVTVELPTGSSSWSSPPWARARPRRARKKRNFWKNIVICWMVL